MLQADCLDGACMTTPESDGEERARVEEITAMLPHFEKSRGNLIPILQSIQEKHAYLSGAAMEQSTCPSLPARFMGLPLFTTSFAFTRPASTSSKFAWVPLATWPAGTSFWRILYVSWG